MADKPDARALIAETRRLDAAATPGPWREWQQPEGVCCAWKEALPPRSVCIESMRTVFALGVAVAASPSPGNAAFIIGARECLPRLADELEAALVREVSVQRTNEALASDCASYAAQAAAAHADGETARAQVVALAAAAKAFADAVEENTGIDFPGTRYETFCRARAALRAELARGGQ